MTNLSNVLDKWIKNCLLFVFFSLSVHLFCYLLNLIFSYFPLDFLINVRVIFENNLHIDFLFFFFSMLYIQNKSFSHLFRLHYIVIVLYLSVCRVFLFWYNSDLIIEKSKYSDSTKDLFIGINIWNIIITLNIPKTTTCHH